MKNKGFYRILHTLFLFDLYHYRLFLFKMNLDVEHPLSLMREDIDNGTNSVFRKTCQNMLFQSEVLQDYSFPYHITYCYKIEFEYQLRKYLGELIRNVYTKEDFDYFQRLSNKVVFVNIESPFSDILGVDQCSVGWNLIGNLFSCEKKLEIPKSRFYTLVKKLYCVFKKKFTLDSYRYYSLKTLETKLLTVDAIDVDDEFLYEMYEQELHYPETLIDYMEKRCSYKTRIWTDEMIVRRVYNDHFKHEKSLPCRVHHLSNLKLLELYEKGKLNCSQNSRTILENYHEKELTSSEIETRSKYIPCHSQQGHVFISSDHPCHPNFPRQVHKDGRRFDSIMNYIHYKLYIHFDLYGYDIDKTFQSHRTWEDALNFQFYRLLGNFIVEKFENIDCGLTLLQMEKKKECTMTFCPLLHGLHSSTIWEDFFLVTHQEMMNYLPSDPMIVVFVEKIVRCMDRLILLMRGKSIEEQHLIRFYFYVFFGIDTPPVMESSIVYSIEFQHVSNNSLMHSYIQQCNMDYERGICFDRIICGYQRYFFTEKTFLTELCMIQGPFQKMVRDFFSLFHLHVESFPNFEDQKELTFVEYTLLSTIFT